MILTRGIYSLSNYDIRFEQYEVVENDNNYISTRMIYPIERENIQYFDKDKEFRIEHLSPNFHPILEIFITDKEKEKYIDEFHPESHIRSAFQKWFQDRAFDLSSTKCILPTISNEQDLEDNREDER